MLKRSVLSLLAGAALAALLLLGPATVAAFGNCYHDLCEDIEGYTYAGCTLHMNAQGFIDVVVCSYIGAPDVPHDGLLHEAGHIN